MAYSTPEEIAAFTHRLVEGVADDLRENGVTPTSRPMLVLDMDGNIAIGHNVVEGAELPLSSQEDPQRHGIPVSESMAELIENGQVEQAIFSRKPMDTRLPQNLVDKLNQLIAKNRQFDVTLLTSRSTDDALEILALSGVEYPEKVTLVGDSGAVLRVDGEARAIRPLNTEEKEFLAGLGQDKLLEKLESGVDKIFSENGISAENRPRLFVESKGIAINIHFADILGFASEREGSALDTALGEFIREELEKHIVSYKKSDVFGTLEGPATIEVKVMAVDKGKGLEAVVNTALENGYRPSSVIFAGDDICKISSSGHVSHGTDYAAFKAAPDLQKKTEIPFFTLHTQHPESGELEDKNPIPAQSKTATHAKITPDVIFPTPRETASFITNVIEKSLEKEKEAEKLARLRINSFAAVQKGQQR